MKLLLLAYNKLPINGYSVVSFQLEKSLSSLGWKTKSLYCMSRDQMSKDHLLRSPFQSRCGINFIWDLGILLFMRLLFKPSVTLCTCEHFALPCYLLSRIIPFPYCVIVHGTYANLPRRSKLFYNAFVGSSIIFCVSDYTRGVLDLDQHCKIKVIPNGVDKSFYFPSPHAGAGNSNKILFVGNSKPRKGLSELIGVLKLCQGLKYVLIVVSGQFGLHPEHRRDLVQNGIPFEDRGALSAEELRDLYREAAVTCMLSRHIGEGFEGFGLTLAEGLACGCRVLGSLESGNPTAVQGNVCHLVDFSNPDWAVDAAVYLEECLRSSVPNIKIESDRLLDWRDVALRYNRELESLVK